MLRCSLFGFFATASIVMASTLIAAEPSKPLAVGATVENFTLDDVRSSAHSLADLSDSKLVVVAFLGTECPLAKQYGGRLQQLTGKYKAQGVSILGVFSNQQDSLAEISHFARTLKLELPLLKDPGNKVADQFHAARTPEVFVLDADRKLAYHGRIDDQFTYGRQKPKIEHDYLTEAIDALLAGKPVATPETDAVGCHIGRVLEPDPSSEVTYTKQIAGIFNANCVRCHRPGEIGPFTLTNYQECVGWAEMIREVVEGERMPPWHADPKVGHFINDTRLSDEDKKLIYQWVDAGAPQGDPKDMPPQPTFTDGWQIGTPDQIVYMREEAFDVPDKGEVRYQHFVVDPGFKEDKWISAAECRPGNRAVVHHIIVGVIPPGGRKKGSGLNEEWLTATAPGARPLELPEGLAKLVPAGSRLVFQMHYTPNGTAQSDRSCVGLKFADPNTVKHQVVTDKAAENKFRIPPGASDHKVEAYHHFDRDMQMLAMFPHMHLRGKSFKYTAIYPSGEKEVLLDVPHYDFNWQNAYAFAEPKLMPKGTKLYCEATFDNSDANLANPDPSSEVRWGDQTWEEMMIGYFDAMPVEEAKIGSLSRTQEFVAAIAEAKPKLEVLKASAAKVLESNEATAAFGLKLHEVMPQVDRLCYTTVEDGKLQIRRCIQAKEIEKALGGAGRSIDARVCEVARYAKRKEPVMVPKLSEAEGMDMAFMSKVYSSSYHVPVKIDGVPGTINFWSAEPDAFPPEATEALKEIAAAMAK